MPTLFASWEGQRRGLRGTPATVHELAAAVRTAYGWSADALLQFSWMDEDNNTIQMSADSEVVETIEIASKSGTPLIIHVLASGDLSIVHPPEEEDWFDVAPGLQEQVAQPEQKERAVATQKAAESQAEDRSAEREDSGRALHQIAQMDKNAAWREKQSLRNAELEIQSMLYGRLEVVSVREVEHIRSQLLSFVSLLNQAGLARLLSDNPVYEIRSQVQDVVIGYRVNVFCGQNLALHIILRMGGQRIQITSEDIDCLSYLVVGTAEIKVCGIVEAREVGEIYFKQSPNEPPKEHVGHLTVLSKFSTIPGSTFYFPRNMPFALKASNSDCLELRLYMLREEPDPQSAYYWQIFNPGPMREVELDHEHSRSVRDRMLQLYTGPSVNFFMAEMYRDALMFRIAELQREIEARQIARFAPHDERHGKAIGAALAFMVEAGIGIDAAFDREITPEVVLNDDQVVMYRITLTEPSASQTIRLHLFLDSSETYIHNHQSNCMSVCLFGGYEHTIWVVDPSVGTHGEKTRSTGGALSEEVLHPGNVTPASIYSHEAGHCYYLSQQSYHTVSIRSRDGAPAVVIDHGGIKCATLSLFFKDFAQGTTKILVPHDATAVQRVPPVVKSGSVHCITDITERERILSAMEACLHTAALAIRDRQTQRPCVRS